MSRCGTHTRGVVAVNVAAVERDGAASDEDATTLRWRRVILRSQRVRDGTQRDVARGGSALQQGNGMLREFMSGCGTHTRGVVAVDVAAVERGGAATDLEATDVDATTLRSQRQGQHSAGPRNITGLRDGWRLLTNCEMRRQANRRMKGWVSTQTGRWNLTGRDRRVWHSQDRCCRGCRSCQT